MALNNTFTMRNAYHKINIYTGFFQPSFQILVFLRSLQSIFIAKRSILESVSYLWLNKVIPVSVFNVRVTECKVLKSKSLLDLTFIRSKARMSFWSQNF